MCFISKVFTISQAKTLRPYCTFCVKMLNELSLYVLVHSTHQRALCVQIYKRCWWDKPASYIDINHCISTWSCLWKVDYFSYQSFTTCSLPAVSRRRRLLSISAYSKYLRGQVDSAVAVESHQWWSKHSWTLFMFYTMLFKCCGFILLSNE